MAVERKSKNVVQEAIKLAKRFNHEYVTPEHLLYAMSFDEEFTRAFEECGGYISELKQSLEVYFKTEVEEVNYKGDPELSNSTKKALEIAERFAAGSGSQTIEAVHVLYGISQTPETYAMYYMQVQSVNHDDVIARMQPYRQMYNGEDMLSQYIGIPEMGFGILISGAPPMGMPSKPSNKQRLTGDKPNDGWKKFVTNMNEAVKKRKEPLVGREDVIERTVQILCRKYKSNVVHLGEPGVGKTAIALGLAKLLNEGKVPEQLKGGTIFSLEMSNLVAGSQFRGDFEKKLELVMQGIQTVKNPIVYIDEIHTIVGAGTSGDSNLDASNMLKKYLTEGKIKFIGATTYEEYKKYFEKDKALNRRFKAVEVKEPTISESIEILKGIQKYYEDYHNVRFTEDAIKSAVELSAKYITERFLPDKAIDLMDEAGAYVAIKRTSSQTQLVDCGLIEEVLAKTCNIPKQTVETDEVGKLEHLEDAIKASVFGQDTAVEELVRCIKLSRAGLNDDNKPVGSFLFVGPTGTGKTEIARVLSSSLGVKMIKFDMSEYQEAHTVSKLIGSPAGYIGHEEGGLLTEAIRKNPHCVLLLDEVEKAHPAIYNMLLQIMDDATLTDNQGRKADFRNVVIIMTSNAGARDIGKRGIGFNANDVGTESMDKELKNVFAPEFRNRLTKIIKFNAISDEMALKIAEKQFNKLREKAKAKGVNITVTKKCYKAIADMGTSLETGAREIGRIIDNKVKPLLVDEMLFGKLKNGGNCKVDFVNDAFKVSVR